MKILITGGAGYIGSVLVGKLLSTYKDLGDLDPIDKITVVDTMELGQNSIGQYCDHDKFKFIKQDVVEWDPMEPLYAEHDVIIPLAGLVGAPLS